MKVRSIEIKNFMSHDSTVIELPDRGVVVLTGPNGAGKSTIIEAVSVGYWGRTLRGTPAWRKGESGDLRVVNHNVTTIRRVTKGGAKRLEWRHFEDDGIGYRKYDTPSKAEAELTAIVGAFDVWRRTHVFSSSDAMNFSTSTDGARKRFIEQILGLDRFDTAFDKCKADLAAAQRKTSRGILEAQKQLRAQAVESLEALVDPSLNLPIASVPIPEPEGGRARMRELAGAGLVAADALKLLQNEPADVVDLAIVARYTQAVAQERDAARVWALVQAENCGECGQPYTLVDYSVAENAQNVAMRELAVAGVAVSSEESRVALASTARRRRAGELQAEATRLREAYDAMAREFNRVELRAAEIERHAAAFAAVRLEHEKTLTRNRDRRAELNVRIFDCDDEIDAATAEIEAAEAEVAVLEACHKVLGLKGVRVPVLGNALEAAEFFANGGLAGLGRAGLKIRLRPYRVLAGGRTNADIGFEVEGAGGGYGYDATSGGERRRIDACLLLAFAEVSAAGSGCPDGTLWVDELFDAIDADGCTAAARMLADIGKRRCVVVITHREDLARQIQAVARYRVDDGVVAQTV